MAAATIQGVMEAIEKALITANIRATNYMPDQVSPPHAVIGVPDIPAYHLTFAHGKMEISPTITVLTSKAYDRVGQDALAAFANPAGAMSIHAAIEADKTLGGVVDECVVLDFRKLFHEEVGAIQYYGGIFTLRVIAKGV